MIKEINNKSPIKTYLTKIEAIIKEIIYKDTNEYYMIRKRIEEIKEKIKIYDIIEEKNKIYIVIDNSNEAITEIDKLILDKNEIKKEGILKDQGCPVSKKEILDLLSMEKSMCKIIFEKYEDNVIKKGKGSGFFCKIDNFPIKYTLFTNNHILDEDSIKVGNIINIEYLAQSSIIEKKIEIDEKRRVYTNKELDYTCIELYESDGIKEYFKIDPILFTNKKNYLQKSDIFILQYPEGNELSFSYGKIKLIKENNIYHSSSTKEGSSGSPIIRRSKENFVIGLHCGGFKKDSNYDYSFNLATLFDSILKDIEKPNEIDCIYKINNDENLIKLLFNYNIDIDELKDEEIKKLFVEAKEINTNFFEENIELYIDGEKKDFDYYYKVNENKEINVKFKFKKRITNMMSMFSGCYFLNSLDLSSFNTSTVTNMSFMLNGCSSLNSINLSSFNTSNVTDMSYMFTDCSSLKSIDLSSFNTSMVTNMTSIFRDCSSLNSIDLSSFNTSNVSNMKFMFFGCKSLNSLDLSSLNTSNVSNIEGMFAMCSSLKSINLSSFNTSNVIYMGALFYGCSSLISIDLSLFNSNKATEIYELFYGCKSLKSIDLSSFNTSKVTQIHSLFDGCSSLKKKKIKTNDKKLLEIIKNLGNNN